VAELVVGVVVDVLRHVFVEHLQGFRVCLAARSGGLLCVLDAAELVVLLPQVRLEQLCGRKEPEDRFVAVVQLSGRRLVRKGGRGPAERPEAGADARGEARRKERLAAEARPLRIRRGDRAILAGDHR